MSKNDKLKEFLKNHDSNNYESPSHELSKIQQTILQKNKWSLPILIPVGLLMAGLATLFILNTQATPKTLTDAELAQYITESYDYLDTNPFDNDYYY